MEGAERDADDRSDMNSHEDRGHPLVDGALGHDEMDEQHRGADGEIDAGGQDDQRLTDRQRGQHSGLLEDDPDRVRSLEAPIAEDREHDARHEQDEGRADHRIACSACWILSSGPVDRARRIASLGAESCVSIKYPLVDGRRACQVRARRRGGRSMPTTPPDGTCSCRMSGAATDSRRRSPVCSSWDQPQQISWPSAT